MTTTTSPELHRCLTRPRALRRLSAWCVRIALATALLRTSLLGMAGAVLTFYASARLTDPLGLASVWVMAAIILIGQPRRRVGAGVRARGGGLHG